MITYIELWKATSAWKNLSTEERGNYMNQLGPAIQELILKGVQIISWGLNDSTTSNRTDYDFFGVWSFPDETMARDFEKMVEGAGWYTYFDQVNASGTAQSPQEVIAKLIQL